MAQPLPSPSEIALPTPADDVPGREIPLPQVGAELARLTAKVTELEARLDESRAQTDRAREIHADDAAKLREAHRLEVSVLEAILDTVSPDWRYDFECPRCEDDVHDPDQTVCKRCLPFVDAEVAS